MSPIGVSTSHSPHRQQTDTAKLWLMLVGVNQYQDERLPSLRYSAVDCQGLAEALVDAIQGFTQKEVKIHHDFASQPPCLDNVRVSLQQITTAAKPQDTVLFYFSGHGMLESNSQEVFLCLADTQKHNLLHTGLALKELLHFLGNCVAKNQLIWLDACHSGGMTFKGATVEPLLNPTPQLVEVLQQSAAKSKGFYALLSCDNEQQSWEFPELGHGVFTYYLMRGLQGDAADVKGVISPDGLYRYVYHQTLQYIDKTNQQIRLINQQKRGKGDTQLFSEYSLQTPKRIVEGVGELILGKRGESSADSAHRRVGVVVEGLLDSKTTLEISKFLGSAGGFDLEYLQATKAAGEDVKAALAKLLKPRLACHVQAPEAETILLYLRGRIKETDAGEGLVLGEETRIQRSWLKQQLRRCSAKQIIILDCPVVNDASLQDWVEDLQLDSLSGQCIIAYSSSAVKPELFAQALFDILMATSLSDGLSAAGAIAQLQIFLADSGIPLHVWLSGAQGIIEILPTKTDSQKVEPSTGLDLGVCPYLGLSAFSEQDNQYFYGRETLTQQLINQLIHSPFLVIVGASGSGKSSVVQAGLIPQLRQGKQIPSSEQWYIRTMRPGTNPLETLAQRLAVERGRGGAGGAGEAGEEITNSPLPTPHSPLPTPHLLEGILHQGVEGFVYWIRSLSHPVVVLVVDQFEELFTLAPKADRENFLELVLGAVEYAKDRFKLIITLRADFIASCLEVPALAKALQQSSVLVPPRLSLDDYRRVIVNPAQKVGLKVEPELVEVLLRELNHSPGDLPLLEFVLEQLWQHRSQGELTLEAYQQQLGGIKGALERACQAVYETLNPEEQECARWIFLSLTQLGEGTEDTRRRVHKSELIVKKYPAQLVERTLQTLTAAKLVVMNWQEDEDVVGGSRGQQGAGGVWEERGKITKHFFSSSSSSSSSPASPASPSLSPSSSTVTVEVAHEILVRHWSTLRWWLEENRDRLRKQRHIEQAAQLWLQSGQQSDFLLQGARLAEAEDIYIKYTDELSTDVQRFIEACLDERKRQQQKEKSRLRQAQRAVVALSFLGISALSFAFVAYWQGREAQLRAIEALNSSSQANFLSNQQLEALIASVKAEKQLKNIIGISVPIKSATLSTLEQTMSEIQEHNRLERHGDGVVQVSFSPDGKTIASASLDKTIKLWSWEGRLLKTLHGHSAKVYSVSFSPDGKTIASGSEDKTVKIWNINDGRLLATLNGHSQAVNNVSFSPDGQLLASASADKTIKLWKSSNASLLKTLNGHTAGVVSLSFSPDGKTIASSSEDHTVKLWNISDGNLLRTLKGHQDWVNSVTFSPDGQLLASGSADRTIKLWKNSDGSLLQTFKGHRDSVWGVRFGPDGKMIASASKDYTVKLWNQHGIELDTFKGHRGGVYSVNFSPQGNIIASASLDGTIRLWQQRDNSLLEILGHPGNVHISFSPQGNIIASGGGDGTIKLWRRSDGILLRTLSGHSKAVSAISFAPNGKTIASASEDKTVKLWRISDGTLLYSIQGHTSDVNSVSFSPDSKTIATASRDNTVKLWRSSNGTLIQTLNGHSAEVFWASFSHQGSTIASASADKTIKLWSASSGHLLKTIPAHNNWVYSVNFSPNGKILASTSADKTVKLWRSSDGKLLHTLQGHSGVVYKSSFSPDGQIIASASEDKTVKLWQLDAHLLKTLSVHSAEVMSVSFSPDGKTLVSGSTDSTAKLWRFEPTQMQSLKSNSLSMRACNWLHDYLHTNPKLSQNDQQICSD